MDPVVEFEIGKNSFRVSYAGPIVTESDECCGVLKLFCLSTMDPVVEFEIGVGDLRHICWLMPYQALVVGSNPSTKRFL
ncbi:reverse transcriptase [Plakobranchus ocellatus]|uniref:Reverse transcriptase n=1 Tax=Plakobranchus ocellatus TaxID=259542 RepID=A0AAV4DQJ0_9GAST|nr:reverse transcriptase [Plakobranchus ocellatus]